MALNSTKFKAVILAGGSGERFWPLSTPERPKQFLKVFGGESLIRQAVSRLKGLVEPENVFVVTSKSLMKATKRELPELPPANIVGEPMRRDTGAAIALSVGLCGAAKHDKIVTLGIKPSSPSTAFGYVDPQTGRFVEKPDLAKAKTYLKKGFLWNAGMFIGRVKTFRSAFAAHAPDLSPLCGGVNMKRLSAVYEPLPKISFDFAVMEALSREGGVDVVPGDFGWDDVGGYLAFDRYYPHDTDGNVVDGDCTVVESSGSICVSKGPRVAVLGARDLVVVATKDSVLVVPKAKAGELKKIVAKG